MIEFLTELTEIVEDDEDWKRKEARKRKNKKR